VRGLQNCIERAVILTEGDTIHARHLNLSLLAPPPPPTTEEAGAWDHVDFSGTLGEVTRRVVGEVERRKIAAVLEQVGGDRAQAADALQVGYKTLIAKLREYGLE
jgi:DNA-binding NtrC family response regulator